MPPETVILCLAIISIVLVALILVCVRLSYTPHHRMTKIMINVYLAATVLGVMLGAAAGLFLLSPLLEHFEWFDEPTRFGISLTVTMIPCFFLVRFFTPFQCERCGLWCARIKGHNNTTVVCRECTHTIRLPELDIDLRDQH